MGLHLLFALCYRTKNIYAKWASKYLRFHNTIHQEESRYISNQIIFIREGFILMIIVIVGKKTLQKDYKRPTISLLCSTAILDKVERPLEN